MLGENPFATFEDDELAQMIKERRIEVREKEKVTKQKAYKEFREAFDSSHMILGLPKTVDQEVQFKFEQAKRIGHKQVIRYFEYDSQEELEMLLEEQRSRQGEIEE